MYYEVGKKTYFTLDGFGTRKPSYLGERTFEVYIL